MQFRFIKIFTIILAVVLLSKMLDILEHLTLKGFESNSNHEIAFTDGVDSFFSSNFFKEAKAEGDEAGISSEIPHANDLNAPINTSEEAAKRIMSVEQIETLSDVEIEILQRLHERKERLKNWEEDLKIKENVLSLTEEKIDKKLEELRVLKIDVEKALSEYRKEENEKTKSLVKIYENMKPKKAAAILEKMLMADLLTIMGRMKEKNAADIMASMDPKVAKELTSRLTRIGRLDNYN